ncbi:hypothetical protein NQ315_004672 [Exocentrus adspersus]|uniref:Transcription elongation factor, mitochondrial n=1 Tax=Exocentrus adspersus TaxID=1586481 RepID=A0AAV8VNG6_9CUCU|nr:hypothetical protein NQ315_004672 [Exocentrus adspersus]
MILQNFFMITIQNTSQAKYSSVNVTHSASGFVFKSNFTIEEQEKVLSVLNRASPEQLASFRVPKNRIKNLQMWKIKKGPFKSLSDVLEVDGLGEKILERMCERIISTANSDSNIKKNNVVNKRLKQLVTPTPSSNTKIESSVGIHLGPMGISWAKLCRDQNEVTDWNCEGFGNLPKKMLPTETFDLAIRITNKLPAGDIYVLETNPSISPQASTQASTVTSYNQQLELTSMLIALINTSIQHNPLLQKTVSSINRATSIQNVVYHLKSRIPARLFKTLVGTEKVSAITTVMELVQNDGKSKSFSLPCTPITLTEQLRNAFLSQSPADKELLSQALMLVVSFMDLCIYKNPVSLVAITPGKNNKK